MSNSIRESNDLVGPKHLKRASISASMQRKQTRQCLLDKTECRCYLLYKSTKIFDHCTAARKQAKPVYDNWCHLCTV